MLKRTAITLLGSLLAIFAIVGCGSSDSSPTKAEYIKQADAICKETEKEKQAKMEAFLTKSSAGQEKPLKVNELTELGTKVILPPMRALVGELNKLDAPKEGATEAEAIVKEFDQVVSKLEKNPLPLASSKSDPFEDVAAQASKYGFKTCILYY